MFLRTKWNDWSLTFHVVAVTRALVIRVLLNQQRLHFLRGETTSKNECSEKISFTQTLGSGYFLGMLFIYDISGHKATKKNIGIEFEYFPVPFANLQFYKKIKQKVSWWKAKSYLHDNCTHSFGWRRHWDVVKSSVWCQATVSKVKNKCSLWMEQFIKLPKTYGHTVSLVPLGNHDGLDLSPALFHGCCFFG